MFSKFHGSEKKKSTFLLVKYSVTTILIEWTNLFRLKSSFLNIRSRQKVSCKKGVLQSFTKFIEKYPSIFNLIKFQAKGLQIFWKKTPVCVLSSEFHRCFKNTYFCRMPTDCFFWDILTKNQSSSTG